MGFLGNPIKKIGGALSKLPGAKTLNKPVNKLMGQTPGLKGVPQKLGMAGPKKPVSPIAPSPNIMEGAIGAGTAAMGNPGPKPMEMQGQPPPVQNFQLPEEAPAPMPMQQQPMEMQSLAAPQGNLADALPQQMPQMQPQQMAGQAANAMGGMLQNKMRQRNTGVTGGRMGPIAQKSGIGPSFM